MAMIIKRFFMLMFSLMSSGIGTAKMMQSKAMSMIACAQTNAFRLIHLPECNPSHEVQMKVTGRQLNVTMTVKTTTLSDPRPMRTWTVLRNRWLGNTRR